jgi:hypothetical protein
MPPDARTYSHQLLSNIATQAGVFDAYRGATLVVLSRVAPQRMWPDQHGWVTRHAQVYNAAGAVIWSSIASGTVGSLAFQSDGNLASTTPAATLSGRPAPPTADEGLTKHGPVPRPARLRNRAVRVGSRPRR